MNPYIEKEQPLQELMDTLSFLSSGFDSILYVYDPENGNIHFAGEIDKKFHLPPPPIQQTASVLSVN